MDKLACEGIIGRVRTIPEGFHPGSDVANLSVLGYDPRKFYTGRASLEAASIGVELKDTDVAYRCNLVTLKFNKDKTQAVMEDYSGGHISTEEAGILINDINKGLGTSQIKFYRGISYRHLMVWSDGKSNAECTPPHDIIGRDISDYLPVGSGEETLRELMTDSVDVLESHCINKERISKGKNPANSIWLWGQGKNPGCQDSERSILLKAQWFLLLTLQRGLAYTPGLRYFRCPVLPAGLTLIMPARQKQR